MTTNGLKVSEIYKIYTPGTEVLSGVSFNQERGQVVALLGPSGCGKSTLLGVIAGLIPQDNGSVHWLGKDLAGTPPHRRSFGLMFQDYALFPHMRVRDNVAFGLRMQGSSQAAIDQKVGQTLEMVGLPGFEQRDVHTLSGGEQQRVALARAIAPNPGLLMLDEPLGSLDRTLRSQLMDDLREIVRRTKQTTLYVTHDQEEAFALADQIVVLQAGRVAQIGSPRGIYQSPNSAFVAGFIGLANLIEGQAEGSTARTILGDLPLRKATRGPVMVLIRPDAASLDGDKMPLGGKILGSAFMGESVRIKLRTEQGVELSFEFPSGTRLPEEGENLALSIETGNGFESFPVDKLPMN